MAQRVLARSSVGDFKFWVLAKYTQVVGRCWLGEAVSTEHDVGRSYGSALLFAWICGTTPDAFCKLCRAKSGRACLADIVAHMAPPLETTSFETLHLLCQLRKIVIVLWRIMGRDEFDGYFPGLANIVAAEEASREARRSERKRRRTTTP